MVAQRAELNSVKLKNDKIMMRNGFEIEMVLNLLLVFRYVAIKGTYVCLKGPAKSLWGK